MHAVSALNALFDDQESEARLLRCYACNEEIDPRSQRRRYCSKACSARRGSATYMDRRRKAAKGSETFTSRDVFERDGFLCQICGSETPRWLIGKIMRNAPTVDHIVPLSKGGAHDLGNVQCACFGCNSAKGDRIPSVDVPHLLRKRIFAENGDDLTGQIRSTPDRTVRDIAKRANLSMATVRKVLDALVVVAVAELLRGGNVPLPGVGRLKLRRRKPRSGRAYSGERIVIPAKRVIVLTPSAAFAEDVANGT